MVYAINQNMIIRPFHWQASILSVTFVTPFEEKYSQEMFIKVLVMILQGIAYDIKHLRPGVSVNVFQEAVNNTTAVVF